MVCQGVIIQKIAIAHNLRHNKNTPPSLRVVLNFLWYTFI